MATAYRSSGRLAVFGDAEASRVRFSRRKAMVWMIVLSWSLWAVILSGAALIG